jgi:hypothetical protein
VPAGLPGRHQRLVRACSSAQALQLGAPRAGGRNRGGLRGTGRQVAAVERGGGEHGRARAVERDSDPAGYGVSAGFDRPVSIDLFGLPRVRALQALDRYGWAEKLPRGAADRPQRPSADILVAHVERTSERGGTGRRVGFRSRWPRPWGFESPRSHQSVHCSNTPLRGRRLAPEHGEDRRLAPRAAHSNPGRSGVADGVLLGRADEG